MIKQQQKNKIKQIKIKKKFLLDKIKSLPKKKYKLYT